MVESKAGREHAGPAKQTERPEPAREQEPRAREGSLHALSGVTSATGFHERVRALSPAQCLRLHGSLGNRAIAAHRRSDGLFGQLHPAVAARASRAFPVSARHVSLQSGFTGMGEAQALAGEGGLLGASRGARVALAPALFRELQTARPSDLAERTLYHELAHTRQRFPAGARGPHDDVRIAHDPRNEAEADALAERARRGDATESPTASFSGGPPRVQASMTRARREAESRRRFAEASKAYELHMGGVLRRDQNAHDAADQFLTELQPITTAWAQATGQQLADVLEKSYGWKGGDKYYGAFRMTAQNINRVFQSAATRPLREKLKVAYNAVRNNNFAKWLKVAAQQLDMELRVPLLARGIDVQNVDDGSAEHVDATFSQSSGLRDKFLNNAQAHNEALNAVWRDEAPDPISHMPVHKTGANKYSQAMSWSPLVQSYNADRIGGQNKDRDALRMSPLKMKDIDDLTDPEIDQIGLNQGRIKPSDSAQKLRVFRKTFRSQEAKGNQPVPWEKGTGYYDVLIDSQTEQLAHNVRARLLAGVSGSTDLMLHAARYMNFSPQNMLKLRLAMLGWMLEAEDHSFFEVMEAATAFGLPFDRGARPGEMYEIDANFSPMHAADFCMEFAIDGAPEGEAYPSAFLDTTAIDEIAIKDPNVSLAAFRSRYGDDGLGLPSAILRSFAIDDMADVEQLDAAVRDAPIKAGSTRQAHNYQQRRRLRATAAYTDLAHRRPIHAELILDHLIKIHHGANALGDYEARLLGASEHLPDADADEAARRQILIDAGVSDQLANGLQPVDLNQALELRALIRTAGFDVAPDRDAAAVRKNSDKLKQIKALRPYVVLQGRIGIWMNALLGGLLAELDPSLRAEGLGLANTSPEANALIARGVPEAIACCLDAGNVALAKRATGRARTIAKRPVGKGAINTELTALVTDLLTNPDYARLAGALGEQNLRIVVFGAARAAGFDFAFTTKKGKKDALPGFTAATLGEVLQSKDVRLDQTELTALKAQVLERNFPGPSRNTGVREMDETKQRMSDNLDDVNIGARYNGGHKASFRGLDPVEVFGINQYTQHYGMGVWQGMLGSRDSTTPWTGVGERSAQEQAWVMKAAVSGLNKLPAYAGRVYNGQPLPLIKTGIGGTYDLNHVAMYVNINYPIGRIIRQDTFFSTARSVDASFISKDTHNLAWVIDGVRSGRDIQPISDKPGEEEVLFPPGAKFMVVKVDDSQLNTPHVPNTNSLTGKLVIHLVEV